MKNEKLNYRFPAPYFPDWDEVSDIYKYRAFDANGDLFYYVNEPELCEELSNWTVRSYRDFESKGSASWRWARWIWRDSLEQRP